MMDQSFMLGPAQALQLMALSVLLRDGELKLSGEDAPNVERAVEVLIDIGQEIALQMGGGE